MKIKRLPKLTAALLITTMLTACTGPVSGGDIPQSRAPKLTGTDTITEQMTIGQLADYFINAADDYNHGVDRAAVLEGFTESKQATRLQMFVLASRAFGDLPAPAGNGKNTAPPAVDLTGALEWSWSALRNLSDGGVLAAFIWVFRS